jgi:hypothetical protein
LTAENIIAFAKKYAVIVTNKTTYETSTYNAVRAILRMNKVNRQTFIGFLEDPKSLGSYEESTAWLRKHSEDWLMMMLNNQPGKGNIRGQNRQQVKDSLIQRAMNIAKIPQPVPDVGELAELCYAIWMAKDRKLDDRYLYHATVGFGKTPSWRNFIQTEILGFKSDNSDAKNVIKFHLMAEVTKVVPHLEVNKKKWSEKDETRVTWSKEKLQNALKRFYREMEYHPDPYVSL